MNVLRACQLHFGGDQPIVHAAEEQDLARTQAPLGGVVTSALALSRLGAGGFPVSGRY